MNERGTTCLSVGLGWLFALLTALHVHLHIRKCNMAPFLSHRVQARWGAMSIVSAEKVLLSAALADRANTHFSLLSET